MTIGHNQITGLKLYLVGKHSSLALVASARSGLSYATQLEALF